MSRDKIFAMRLRREKRRLCAYFFLEKLDSPRVSRTIKELQRCHLRSLPPRPMHLDHDATSFSVPSLPTALVHFSPLLLRNCNYLTPYIRRAGFTARCISRCSARPRLAFLSRYQADASSPTREVYDNDCIPLQSKKQTTFLHWDSHTKKPILYSINK